jgi:F-type H+-transporting ATPase subunit a
VTAAAVLAGASFEPPGASSFWQPLIGDGPFAITRTMFVISLSVVLIAVVMIRSARGLQLVPGKAQFAVEGLYGFVRNSVAIDFIGRAAFRPYMPLLVTIFLLLLVNNVAGIIPFVQFPTFSRVAYPIALTLVVYVVYHAIGIRRKGLGGYLSGLMPPGVPTLLVPLVYLLELLTYFVTRPLTLSLRLFANMFAGHVVLLVFALGGEFLLLEGSNPLIRAASVGSFAMAILMTLFELLVQVLQAYVFVLLTAYYIADALAEEH